MTTFVNVLLLISIISIWGILIVNVVLVIAGYIYYLRTVNQPPKPLRRMCRLFRFSYRRMMKG